MSYSSQLYEQLTAGFNWFDKNNGGKISKSEFGPLLEWTNLVHCPSQAQIDKAFTTVVFYFAFTFSQLSSHFVNFFFFFSSSF